jgi:hypothetical protein
VPLTPTAKTSDEELPQISERALPWGEGSTSVFQPRLEVLAGTVAVLVLVMGAVQPVITKAQIINVIKNINDFFMFFLCYYCKKYFEVIRDFPINLL